MTNTLSPLRLPVRTESGQPLGVVVDLSVDPDTQAVISYHVKPNRLVPDVVRSPLIINRSQVVELTADALIVDDNTARIAQQAPAPQPSN